MIGRSQWLLQVLELRTDGQLGKLLPEDAQRGRRLAGAKM